MKTQKKEWENYSPENKLIAIEAYLDGMAKLDDSDAAANNARLEWLRDHLPAYKTDGGKNYIFVSYSHRDYKEVYRDLAYFTYNSQQRVRFWYDEGLPVGRDWEEAAGKFMQDSRCVGVVFYLSRNLLLSPSVFKEIQYVRKYNKPFIAVALSDGYCAERLVTEEEVGGERFSTLRNVFPAGTTALPYGEDYENVLRRIYKIGEVFNVTEEVFSDFVCEETASGLRLVKYVGYKTDVYIPERIQGKPITEISSDFPSAKILHIPKTAVKILPYAEENDYSDVEEIETASLYRLVEHAVGGYKDAGAVFGAAPALEEICVDSDNPVFYAKNGVLYAHGGTLVRVPPKKELKNEFFAGVKTIGVGAAYGCASDDSADLPDSVTVICENAFAETSLLCCDIPSSVTQIKAGAFRGAKFFVNILQIPDGVKTVGEWLCKDSNLDIFFSKTVDAVLTGAAFSSGAEKAYIPGNVKVVEKGAFALCNGLKYVKMEEGVQAIGANAFTSSGCLREVYIPSSVKFIGEQAFFQCDALTYVKYGGTRKEWYALFGGKQSVPEELVKAAVCRGEILRMLKRKIKLFRISRAEKLLEKVGSTFD